MDEYIDVKVDIFEHTGQRAKIRRSLTVSGLIDEILKEFDDIPAESVEKYAIYLKNTPRPLTLNASITELDLQPQDELIFDYKQKTIRQMLSEENFAQLYDEFTDKYFDIQWQPAVIGRPTAEAEHNLLLSVNAQLLPNGMTVSRRHAQITFSDDCFYLEPLSENNPVYVNDKEIPFNSRSEIKNNDKLFFGKHKVLLNFLSQKQVKSSGTEKSRVIPPVIAEEMQSKPVTQPEISKDQNFSKPSDPEVSVSGAVPEVVESVFTHIVIEKASLPEQVGQRIDLPSFPFILGRIIPILSIENGVSRRHAEISYDPQSMQYTITDLNSTNGVFLDGKRIVADKAYKINGGTSIGLGQDVVLKLKA